MVYSQWISNQELYYWKGYECNTGVTRIFIHADENVYNGICKQEKLGNLRSGWNILADPVICKRESCTPNAEDLITFKQQINKDQHK